MTQLCTPPVRTPSRCLLIGAATAALLAGCTAAGEQQPSGLVDPVAALGACDDAPASTGELDDDIAGLLLADVILTRIVEGDPVTEVTGWIAATPVDVKRRYETGQPGVRLLGSEDELVEAEVLLTDGDHRAYLTFTSVCDEASRFVGIIAPELADAPLPPLRGGTPTPQP